MCQNLRAKKFAPWLPGLHRIFEANRFRRAALEIRPTIYDRSTSPPQFELRLPIGSDRRTAQREPTLL